MGKVNVYLPDALEADMRAAKIRPSPLLQQAIRKELRNRTTQDLGHHTESIRFGDQGTAWTFVLVARERGWHVSDPIHNTMPGDTHHVYVQKRGPDDG